MTLFERVGLGASPSGASVNQKIKIGFLAL